MIRLLLATRNEHKIREIRGILGSQFQYLALSDLRDAPTVIEDAGTFAGNAAKKAVRLAKWLSESPATVHTSVNYVLADDSGLEVDALNGAPGVHSARFAALDTGKAGNSSDAENRVKLLHLLQVVPADKR